MEALMEAISKTELARRLKISKPRVSQLVRAGMPVLPDGKVDAAVALDWIARRTDPSHNIGRRQRGPAGPVVAPTPVGATTKFSGDAGAVLLVARAKKAIADAKRAERLERHQAGELIERTEAAAYAANFSMLVRDHMLVQPDRLAERLAASNDCAEVYRILRDDGHTLLVRLSKAILDAALDKQTAAGR
jgi:hypothetical protein